VYNKIEFPHFDFVELPQKVFYLMGVNEIGVTNKIKKPSQITWNGFIEN
jgi:hypothetical protein